MTDDVRPAQQQDPPGSRRSWWTGPAEPATRCSTSWNPTYILSWSR